MSDCIFCRIAAGEIPAQKVYEDDEILAFRDIRPIQPIHVLIIPKRHIESLDKTTDADADVLGRMLVKAGPLARELGAADGFRTIINTGRVGGQEVYHLHLHIIGGGAPLPTMIKH